MGRTEVTPLEKRLERQVRQAVRDFQLIEGDDHILIGLSGGKDSLALAALLAHFAHTHKPSPRLSALHVRMKGIPYETDTDFLRTFCHTLGIALHLAEGEMPPPREGKEKPRCFLCSWTRRKLLFQWAQELGCNKIALGHHNDDILHTALLNQMFAGTFSTMPALLQMRKFPVCVIRPLCMVSEADLAALAAQHGWPRQKKTCPYEHDTKRTSARHLLEMMQRENPDVRHSLWHALLKAGKLTEPVREDLPCC